MAEETTPKISQETIEKALEVVKRSVYIEGGELRLMREGDYEEAANFFRNNFFPDEPISRSVGMKMHPDVANVFIGVFKQGLSIILVSKETGEIMSCRCIGIVKKGNAPDSSAMTYEPCIKVFDFMNGVEKQADAFNRLGVSEIFHFYGLVTNNRYRHRGIATKMMQVGMIFLKELKTDIAWVKGEGTSNYSKRIYEHMGFDVLIEAKYAEYVVDGKVVFDNTGEHKSEKIYAKRIDKKA